MANIKAILSDAQWHCEPPNWSLTDDALTMTTGDKTDFWRETYYGFHRDDGHFLGIEVSGDFAAEVSFEADYRVLYDQAGLMMRADAGMWLKVGVEYSDDLTNFSTVVTRDKHSDWSVVGMAGLSGLQRVRLTRTGDAVLTHFLTTEGTWRLMRLSNFPADVPVRVGPMACTPERGGLQVRFQSFSLGPPPKNPLHAAKID